MNAIPVLQRASDEQLHAGLIEMSGKISKYASSEDRDALELSAGYTVVFVEEILRRHGCSVVEAVRRAHGEMHEV